MVYGVNQKKWYAQKIPKDSVEALKLAGKMSQFQEREEVFSQHRAGLMHLIRLILARKCDFKHCVSIGTVLLQSRRCVMDSMQTPGIWRDSSST